jgi:thiamine biosynthesis lipoprotein
MTSVDPNRIPFFTKGAALAALFACLLTACTPRPQPAESVTFEGSIMGTTFHVKLVAKLDDAATAAAANAVEAALQRVDGKMSTYKTDSELSQLNQHAAGAPVTLSDETFKVLALAQQVNAESGGAFDVTVGPLVNAWGFGPTDLESAPSDEVLAGLRALTGPDKIQLDPAARSVTKALDGVYCDLSAIAKGYGVDQAAEALLALGYQNFMVEVGGEVRTSGLNTQGVAWRIAIEKPLDYDRAMQEIVGLSNMSLATSGNYRNFYMDGDKRISHTINPRTGRPVDHALASVSVIHPECALADAYATALMVLGPDEGMAFAERLGLAVFFIIHGDGDALVTRQTPGFAPYLVAH